ncbi:hypothetical protein D3C73_173040 [compost metagenome]
MEFSQSTLMAEYDLIRRDGQESYYSFDCTFVTEKEEIPAMMVVSTDTIRDYRNAATDEVLIKVVLPWGQYLNRVLPFKENLKMTVTRSRVGNQGERTADAIVVQTFNVYLPTEGETSTMADSPETATEYSADLSGMKTVTVQLQEEAFSLTRSELVGGVFRDSTPFDILIALLDQSIKGMELEVEQSILGINSIPPNNLNKRGTTIIPHGTPLVSVADKLQAEFGGIYTAGIGCYLQKGFWHVWPPYNFNRYDEAEYTALFILAPSQQYRGVERTWRIVDKHLTVFVTGGVQRMDPSEILLLNEGNGTRFANTDAMMEGFFEVSGNKAVAKRTNNANEYEAVSRKANNMSRVSGDIGTSNAFNEASKIAVRNGAFLTMNWENSNPDTINPGLQCEVGFLVDGNPEFVKAVVVHAHAYSAVSGTGLHQKIHQITTEVVVMVDRQNPAYKKYLDEASDSTQS